MIEASVAAAAVLAPAIGSELTLRGRKLQTSVARVVAVWVVGYVAAASPGDCFYMAQEAVRIAVEFMTPCFLLTDGYLANGAEPWRIPSMADMKPIVD